jgi:hypothetical protein
VLLPIASNALVGNELANCARRVLAERLERLNSSTLETPSILPDVLLVLPTARGEAASLSS